MLKAIMFDVYGTLISTGDGSINATKQILQLNSCSLPTESFYKKWKYYHKRHIEELDTFVNEETIFLMDLKKLYKEYGFNRNFEIDVTIMLDTLGKRTLFPETQTVIDRLSQQFTICTASTTDTIPLLKDLERNKLNIKHIFTSENLKIYKPNKEFYQKIIQELSLNVNEVLFVGDSLIDDVIGPHQIGLKTCWLNRKKIIQDNTLSEFEINDLTEIFKVIDSFNLL